MSIPLETPDKGRLLIAEPFLSDPGFDRSVVLLTDYTFDGAVGFVLNRPMDLHMEQVLDDFPPYEPQIYFGGPVQQNNLYYLHRRGDLIIDSQEVLPGLFWGGKISAVKEMLRSGLMPQDEIRFFLGYSGWGKAQLSNEIKERSWLVIKPNVDVLATDAKSLWKNLILDMGGDYRLWANAPSDPILN